MEVEVMAGMRRAAVLLLVLLGPAAVEAAGVTLGARIELTHPGKGHEAHVSAPALGVTADGAPLLTWAAKEGEVNHLYVARPADPGARPLRVNPADLLVEALHHSPLLATGPGGEIYLSWSSDRAKPAGTLFASDLRLSRSLDGGRSFGPPLRVTEDQPISHSFDGLAVAPDGTVLVSWIDGREGGPNPVTYLARVAERGERVERTARLDGDTCVCCRVALAAGPGDAVAVLWRKVFPGDIRDMVLGLSRDGGRTFAAPARVRDDGWKINACPHRGGQVAMDARGRLYAAWYTEGARGLPRMLFATSTDGRRFGPAVQVTASSGSIPDQVRLAVNGAGAAVIVWEDSTAVRRRVLLRATSDGGRTFGAVRTLSDALKAYAPDVKVAPSGDFLVAWHEERFPALKAVVRAVQVRAGS
jgi:hypothetical protein